MKQSPFGLDSNSPYPPNLRDAIVASPDAETSAAENIGELPDSTEVGACAVPPAHIPFEMLAAGANDGFR